METQGGQNGPGKPQRLVENVPVIKMYFDSKNSLFPLPFQSGRKTSI